MQSIDTNSKAVLLLTNGARGTGHGAKSKKTRAVRGSKSIVNGGAKVRRVPVEK